MELPNAKTANESAARTAKPRRRSSVALRASLAMLGFLVAVVGLVLYVVQRDADHVALTHSLGAVRATVVLSLTLLIPVATYFVVRFWMNEGQSTFADLQSAWDAGVEALDAAGIPIDATPLFLLVGFEGERAAHSFFEATGIEFPVNGAPDRAAPIRWFAHRQGIFLCCTGVGGLSALAMLVERSVSEYAVEASASKLGGVGVGSEETALPFRAAPTQRPVRMQTMNFDDEPDMEDFATGATFQLESPTTVPSSAGLGRRRIVSLPTQDEVLQSQRLEELCGMLRARRSPLCPVNGIVMILPVDGILGEEGELEQLQRLARADLESIRRALEMRAPTTAVVTNCDRGTGFRELMRRVGRDRCAKHRFGHRFNLRSHATYEAVSDFAEQLSGVFEDWIYALFREGDVLTRPGNTRLHGLLCRVRSVMKERLASVLAGALGDAPDQQRGEGGVLFSGCYFCATGPREDRRAFVRGVVDKLESEQEDVEWTLRAERRDRRLRRLATVGYALTGLLALAAILLWIFGND